MPHPSWRTRYARIRDIVYLEYDLSDESDLPTADDVTLDEALSIAQDIEAYYTCLDDDNCGDGYDPANRQIVQAFIHDFR